jgi:hypothetical protein
MDRPTPQNSSLGVAGWSGAGRRNGLMASADYVVLRCFALRSAGAATPRCRDLVSTVFSVAEGARSLGLTPVAGRMRLARASYRKYFFADASSHR